MPLTNSLHVTGHCYCGAVTYKVDMPAGKRPRFALYCHCDSCRRAHAAALSQVVCVDTTMLTITAGAELVTEFSKPPNGPVRAFCSACGSRMYNAFPGWKPDDGTTPVVFFTSTLDQAITRELPERFRPTGHNYSEECVLDLARLEELLAGSKA
ncbi:MAG: hypothetical protein ACI9VR_002681 [Cognaticolwellia sp.]|jgi:hypothetical protein